MSDKTTKAGATAPAELTLEQANAQIKDLTAGVDALNSANAALEEKSDKQDKIIEGQAKELEDAANVVEELKAQLKDAGTDKAKGHLIKIGKDTYKVTGGTIINKKAYTAGDIASDKELAVKLIDKGSTHLQKIS